MIKITETYKDYNGVTRTEEFNFHIKRSELIEMEYTTPGGLSGMLDNLIQASDTPELIKTFKDIVLKAYGKISPDGRRFMKTPEIRQEFAETEAYSQIFMRLAMDAKAASEFVNGIIPELTEEEKKEFESKKAEMKKEETK